MEMTNSNLNAFRSDFATTVASLEKKYGVKIELGTVRYQSDNFHTTMTVLNKNTSTGHVMVSSVETGLRAVLWGKDLPEGGLVGRIAELTNGERFTIDGYEAKARKYPILVKKTALGPVYKVSPLMIRKVF